MKLILTLIAVLSLAATAYGMGPYTAPDLYDSSGWLFSMNEFIGAPCPNCGCYRLWPNEQFLKDRVSSLTADQAKQLFLGVTTYTGDVCVGRKCEFCGLVVGTGESDGSSD